MCLTKSRASDGRGENLETTMAIKFESKTDLHRYLSDVINPSDYRCGDKIIDRMINEIKRCTDFSWGQWYATAGEDNPEALIEINALLNDACEEMDFYEYLGTLDDDE